MEIANLISLISPSFIAYIILIALFIISTISIIKNIVWNYTKNKEKWKPIWPLLSYVIGAILGFAIFPNSILINIICGAVVGYFSPVIYRIILKTIFKKYGIEISQSGNYLISISKKED
jgi:prepilin signal peptidase PulO-like enzyme (type II secretory pathway)